MDNADLEKLRVSAGKLIPKFKASVTDYSVTVGSSVSEIKLTVLTSDSGASYTIKGSDGGGKVVKIAEGQSLDVEITVSAEDGSTSKTYSIKMRRLSADDATLSQLELSAGTLSPAFSPFVQSYECNLPCSTSSITLRAKAEEEAMKISMLDGSPVGTIQLSPGRTLCTITVQSVNGKGKTEYTIIFAKTRLPPTLQLKKKQERFECAVCCGVVSKPTSIIDGPFVYCLECLEELTKTNKMDPFTGKKIEQQDWMKPDFECDVELGKEEGVCPLPSVTVEGPLSTIGSQLMTEGRKLAEKEEAMESCKECSKKVPQADMPLHKELLCSAKHPSTLKKQEPKLKGWEKRLVDATAGSSSAEINQDWEAKYLRSLPFSGETLHYAPNEGPLDYLTKAAQACAQKVSPKDSQTHVAVGRIQEEFFYAEDLFGLKLESVGLEEGEGEAEISSKEEEFAAICKLHGVSSSAPAAVQLKAVETEYLSLKEAGQAHKADHVQGLYAWKSKKLFQASQGSYAVDQESPLYRAKLKYQDAVGVNPSDGVACYHLGRLSLLLGDQDTAREYLTAALALKPSLSPARFCLGLVLPNTATAHTKNLLLHGLSRYLAEQQRLHQTNPLPQKEKLKELHADNFYRSSNTLIADGFLKLASLSGHGHLSSQSCLLSVTPSVGRAHLHHRASTYQRLHWASLQARAVLLTLLHKQGDKAALRHCRQLSALISCSGMDPTPQRRKMQMEVFQLGVVLQPSSSEALCHLGNGQLMQYDAATSSTAGSSSNNSDAHWLQDAELSFRASLELEGKQILPNSIPEKLKEQKWWKEREDEAAKKVKVASPPTKGPTSTTSGGGGVVGGGGGVKKPAVGRGGPRQPPAAAGRQAAVPQGRGKPVGGAAAKTQTAAGRSGSSSRPVAGPIAGRGGTGARGPAKPGPAGAGKTTTTGKSVATLGELKSGANGKTAPPTTSPSKPAAAAVSKDTPPADTATPSPPPQPQGPVETNKPSYHPRLGLARTLAKTGDAKKIEESHSLYKAVITMSPDVHDAYIELGELLAKTDPEGAVDVYSKFPFSDPPTFDDAFLHGEIVRLLMKSEKYDNPGLARSMIAMGKALGIGVLEKQVAILEGKFKSALLKQVYAGVHNKPVEDPELQAFFKFKCWL